jgi:hypothetical protein
MQGIGFYSFSLTGLTHERAEERRHDTPEA